MYISRICNLNENRMSRFKIEFASFSAIERERKIYDGSLRRETGENESSPVFTLCNTYL